MPFRVAKWAEAVHIQKFGISTWRNLCVRYKYIDMDWNKIHGKYQVERTLAPNASRRISSFSFFAALPGPLNLTSLTACLYLSALEFPLTFFSVWVISTLACIRAPFDSMQMVDSFSIADTYFAREAFDKVAFARWDFRLEKTQYMMTQLRSLSYRVTQILQRCGC